MNKSSTRLFFIDAIRAWAILMMLQGHFIDGLLDPSFRDTNNIAYNIWLYFRGITAPVFFTVSGFIFTYLLTRVPEVGWENRRVKKGLKRGLELLLIGYLLRINIGGLIGGHIYPSFFLVDVLHCIGLSILTVIGIYLLTIKRQKLLFPSILFFISILLFLYEPLYKQWDLAFLPTAIANYFTKANGSVFTIIPWLGYATFGGFLSILFKKFEAHRNFYQITIPTFIIIGCLLIYQSSDLFFNINKWSGIELFQLIFENNYLFIRLGDVFIVFALFMLLRKLLTHTTILKIGSSTLTIYIIHFIILYGSFTGLGLYRFFHHELTPTVAISGALLFMVVCTFLSIQYEKHKVYLKEQISTGVQIVGKQLRLLVIVLKPYVKILASRLKVFLGKLFPTAKG